MVNKTMNTPKAINLKHFTYILFVHTFRIVLPYMTSGPDDTYNIGSTVIKLPFDIIFFTSNNSVQQQNNIYKCTFYSKVTSKVYQQPVTICFATKISKCILDSFCNNTITCHCRLLCLMS